MWENGKAAVAETPTSPRTTEKPAEQNQGTEQSGKKAKDEVTQLREQLAAYEKRLAELAESERYWAERARAAADLRHRAEEPEEDEDAEDQEPPDEPEIEDDSPDKLVDEFSTEGIKALVKRGLLTKKQAREIIKREAAKIAREIVSSESRKLAADAELLNKFPELADEKSALFKKTGEIYRSMVERDPSIKKSPQALFLAARAAKAELELETRLKEGDKDQSRIGRIAAQSGERGVRGAGFQEEDEELSPTQRMIIEKFNADGGVQISPESYIKRAKEGVRMSARMVGYNPGAMNWR